MSELTFRNGPAAGPGGRSPRRTRRSRSSAVSAVSLSAVDVARMSRDEGKATRPTTTPPSIAGARGRSDCAVMSPSLRTQASGCKGTRSQPPGSEGPDRASDPDWQVPVHPASSPAIPAGIPRSYRTTPPIDIRVAPSKISTVGLWNHTGRCRLLPNVAGNSRIACIEAVSTVSNTSDRIRSAPAQGRLNPEGVERRGSNPSAVCMSGCRFPASRCGRIRPDECASPACPPPENERSGGQSRPHFLLSFRSPGGLRWVSPGCDESEPEEPHDLQQADHDFEESQTRHQ